MINDIDNKIKEITNSNPYNNNKQINDLNDNLKELNIKLNYLNMDNIKMII